MSRSIFIAAMLASSILGGAVSHAQSGDATKCGPVAYDSAKQTYVGIPCNSAATPTQNGAVAPANQNSASAPAKKCGAYDSASQTYVGLPCAAGTTDENPAGRSQ